MKKKEKRNSPPIQPGPTGRFPDGKINPDDKGELAIGIRTDHEARLIFLHFGTPVEWISAPPEGAIEMAILLIQHACKLGIEIEKVLHLLHTKIPPS